MFVVVARFQAKPGREEEVQGHLERMIAFSNAEPGTVLYTVNRSLDDSGEFLLYEQYLDEAGFEAHKSSEPFYEHVRHTIDNLLEHSEVRFYSLLDPR
jgi:quinol monooxygenase YgiN